MVRLAMRRALLVGLAVLLLGSQVGFSMEQTIEPITPKGEQELEVIVPPGEQRVEQVASGSQQDVSPQLPPTATEKTVSNVTKVVTGVTAAGVSLGAMAAMLMFF
jgi:hypothetical protein